MKNQGEPWETLLRESITKDLKKLCCTFFSVSTMTLDVIQAINAFIILFLKSDAKTLYYRLVLYGNFMIKRCVKCFNF